MKLVSAFLFFALSLFSPAVTATTYDILQILFDADNVDSCDDDEWWQIDNAIFVISQQQRKLRGETEAVVAREEVPVDENNRALWPNYCANNCVGYLPRQCRAVNCVGYRRRSLADIVKRNLFWGSNCQNQISEINNLLTNTANNEGFSDSCKWFLSLPRQYNCYSNSQC